MDETLVLRPKRFLRQTAMSPAVLLVVILGLLASFRSILAQPGYPNRTNHFINDYAGLLDSAESLRVRQILMDLKRETGVEAAVVIVDSVSSSSSAHTTVPGFATGLFNAWQIGSRARNDGVLILVALKDREVRIEVGAGYGSSQDANMQEVVSEHMLPSFRTGDHSEGVYLGARAVARMLTKERPGEPLKAGPQPAGPGSKISRIIQDLTDLWWLVVAGIVALASGGVFVTMIVRRRRCPRCHIPLKRLDEVSDDSFLNSGQKLEELLRSIDYKVWKCPQCSYHDLQRNSSSLSNCRVCIFCSYRTLKVDIETISEPTHTSPGTKFVTRHCQNCDHQEKDIIHLPALAVEAYDAWEADGDWESDVERETDGERDTDSARFHDSDKRSDRGYSSGSGASGKW